MAIRRPDLHGCARLFRVVSDCRAGTSRHRLFACLVRTAERIAHTSKCCVPCSDGFTLAFKAVFPDPLAPPAVEFLKDVVALMPSTNVQIEDGFARMRVHRLSSNGNVPGPETLSAAHVLSELGHMHNVQKHRWICGAADMRHGGKA